MKIAESLGALYIYIYIGILQNKKYCYVASTPTILSKAYGKVYVKKLNMLQKQKE